QRHTAVPPYARIIDGLNVLDTPTHPSSFAVRPVLLTREGARILPYPASPLAAATHEDLPRTGAHGAESRRVAPAPQLLPPQLGEPSKTSVHVRIIENQGHAVNDHCAAPK